MPESNTNYDDFLWTIATQTGGISDFLNVIANFLKRRTDFFSGTTNDRWEQLLLKIFHKVSNEKNDLHKKDEEEELNENSKSIIDVSIKTELSPRRNQIATSIQSPRKWNAAKARKPTHSITIGNVEEEISKPIEIATDASEAVDVGKLFPNAGNGCTLTNYSWTQTLGEIELKVPLRVAQPLRSRDVNVNITKKSITVGVKGQMPIIDGELYREIKPDESAWMLQDGMLVCITLEKKKKINWWDRLIMSDPVIATRKIEPELSKLSDLDGSARSTVEKMIYNQNRKRMGLPSPASNTDKQKMEALERFKKIHPELDFSRCQY